MNYCKRCCQPDTRPKIVFRDGVCGACLWEDEKKKIDWAKREADLKWIAEKARIEADVRGTYDCVVGVSGGKDSLFQALYAKYALKLNCLLVSVVPDQITSIGQHNFDNLISKGFDCIRIYVNPNLLKHLMLWDFLNYCHFRKATEYPLWASVFQVAKEKNIPLIIQGENAALTLGVSQDTNTDGDASTVYKTNTIAGETAMQHYLGMNFQSLLLYQFPDLTKWNGQAVWLNYYVKEWSPSNNAAFAIKRGLKIRTDRLRALGRIHKHTCLDSDFHMVSQAHKYYKLGFGFATDEACYDIREGTLTREEGFRLVEKYDGLCDRKYIRAFCDFIGITEGEHWKVVERFKKYDTWDRWEEQTKGIL